ncbi:MAG: hypothetical protein ACE147_05560 [Candidatus Methylomirabilales bacterium]
MRQQHDLARGWGWAFLTLLLLGVPASALAGQPPPVGDPVCVRWCGNQGGGTDRPNPAEVHEQWMEAIGQAKEVEARARKEAETARQVADMAAAHLRHATERLAKLRTSDPHPGEAQATAARVRDAVKDQAGLNQRLAALQQRLAAITVQAGARDVTFGTAVALSEEDLFKKIGPAQFVTPAMYRQAQAQSAALTQQLTELQEQSRYLSTFARDSAERLRVQRKLQKDSVLGLALDLLDLPAPAVARADKKLKVAYEATKSAVAAAYTAQGADYAERTERATQALDNLAALGKEASLGPGWSPADTAELEAAVRCMSLSLQAAGIAISQAEKDEKQPGRDAAALTADYLKEAIALAGIYNPYFTSLHAGISLAERTDQYARAEEAMKSIARMTKAGADAQEYLDGRILDIHQKLEAANRLIRAYRVGGAK